ncbi:phosphate ABC transporter ATP-binding protein [Lyngbya confervoides]|uniref:Phosphate ABC transporter ATP-binding protein n=1 Tax=Lyngbya confervoides BDU141951 TaxID=1574623 RepID=A0ABD4T523_9CYAN|nr:phosphate ABC transporter ATP-binding protein [Lyngbya confervoides]MCM1983337.1 phosphate ABC transporter ATP-binding protein [Lyngbya confervoides BDU141951]
MFKLFPRWSTGSKSAAASAPMSASAQSAPGMRTENLCLFYGKTPAFRAVTLHFAAGQVNAIIGPSGCGKTSLLNCLNRLIELDVGTHLAGQVYLGEDRIQDIPLWQLRRRVGMLFQRPSPFPLSIYRNLAFPLREHGLRDRQQQRRQIQQALEDVGLWAEVKDRLQSPAQALSGGQQQRLCLARALVLKPQVLLMDEPCSALDPIASEVIEDLIRRLRGQYTIVIVTHNLAQASRVADRVAVFWQHQGVGQLIEVGPTQDIFEAPQHPLTQAYVSGQRG